MLEVYRVIYSGIKCITIKAYNTSSNIASIKIKTIGKQNEWQFNRTYSRKVRKKGMKWPRGILNQLRIYLSD